MSSLNFQVKQDQPTTGAGENPEDYAALSDSEDEANFYEAGDQRILTNQASTIPERAINIPGTQDDEGPNDFGIQPRIPLPYTQGLLDQRLGEEIPIESEEFDLEHSSLLTLQGYTSNINAFYDAKEQLRKDISEHGPPFSEEYVARLIESEPFREFTPLFRRLVTIVATQSHLVNTFIFDLKVEDFIIVTMTVHYINQRLDINSLYGVERKIINGITKLGVNWENFSLLKNKNKSKNTQEIKRSSRQSSTPPLQTKSINLGPRNSSSSSATMRRIKVHILPPNFFKFVRRIKHDSALPSEMIMSYDCFITQLGIFKDFEVVVSIYSEIDKSRFISDQANKFTPYISQIILEDEETCGVLEKSDYMYSTYEEWLFNDLYKNYKRNSIQATVINRISDFAPIQGDADKYIVEKLSALIKFFSCSNTYEFMDFNLDGDPMYSRYNEEPMVMRIQTGNTLLKVFQAFNTESYVTDYDCKNIDADDISFKIHLRECFRKNRCPNPLMTTELVDKYFSEMRDTVPVLSIHTRELMNDKVRFSRLFVPYIPKKRTGYDYSDIKAHGTMVLVSPEIFKFVLKTILYPVLLPDQNFSLTSNSRFKHTFNFVENKDEDSDSYIRKNSHNPYILVQDNRVRNVVYPTSSSLLNGSSTVYKVNLSSGSPYYPFSSTQDFSREYDSLFSMMEQFILIHGQSKAKESLSSEITNVTLPRKNISPWMPYAPRRGKTGLVTTSTNVFNPFSLKFLPHYTPTPENRNALRAGIGRCIKLGVLDIDCPELGQFLNLTENDKDGGLLLNQASDAVRRNNADMYIYRICMAIRSKRTYKKQLLDEYLGSQYEAYIHNRNPKFYFILVLIRGYVKYATLLGTKETNKQTGTVNYTPPTLFSDSESASKESVGFIMQDFLDAMHGIKKILDVQLDSPRNLYLNKANKESFKIFPPARVLIRIIQTIHALDSTTVITENMAKAYSLSYNLVEVTNKNIETIEEMITKASSTCLSEMGNRLVTCLRQCDGTLPIKEYEHAIVDLVVKIYSRTYYDYGSAGR